MVHARATQQRPVALLGMNTTQPTHWSTETATVDAVSVTDGTRPDGTGTSNFNTRSLDVKFISSSHK